MLNNQISKTAIDASTTKVYTKIVQSASGSIYKRSDLPFGDVEELKFNSQITKKGRSETLVDLTFTSITDPVACAAGNPDYVRVFVKIDRPELISPEQLTALKEQINMLYKLLAQDTFVDQILNGES
jgi:hypothetical protein